MLTNKLQRCEDALDETAIFTRFNAHSEYNLLFNIIKVLDRVKTDDLPHFVWPMSKTVKFCLYTNKFRLHLSKFIESYVNGLRLTITLTRN